MLVLSRKVGETVVIGGNIQVTVTRVAGNRVTLGITAPPAVRVVRGELGSPTSAVPADLASADLVAGEKGPADPQNSSTAKLVSGGGAGSSGGVSEETLGTSVRGPLAAAAAAVKASSRATTTSETPVPLLTTVS